MQHTAGLKHVIDSRAPPPSPRDSACDKREHSRGVWGIQKILGLGVNVLAELLLLYSTLGRGGGSTW